MLNNNTLAPTVLVVFGATGDLMARKVVPSLFHLCGLGLLPDDLRVVGFGRREWADSDLRAHVRSILAERAATADPVEIEEFLTHFCYQRGEFDDSESYAATARHIDSIQGEWEGRANRLFYLAVPPVHYERIFRNLAASGLTDACSAQDGWTRVLVEKPFGDDQKSARELERLLSSLFLEEQIYRIDHYLAKEMLQGIVNFRFTNNLFEPMWNREGVERIDITLLESIGAEKRGAFYDAVGALRDVGQNHLLQMLALVTMEQPASHTANDIRDARADLIETLRPLTPGEIACQTFRAQHQGFDTIPGVAAGSQTETYFKVLTRMRGARWAGVPVTMESGKRMGPACKRIVVTLRKPAESMFESSQRYTNRVVFTLEPSDRIEIIFFAKKPGFEDEVEERVFSFFLYERAEKMQYVEEYARLMHDAFGGDQTLFVSSREVDAGWDFIDSIVDAWQKGKVSLETYEPDTADITEAADRFLARRIEHGQVGVIGLGKMGAGLARNLSGRGWRVVAFNRTHSVAEAMRPEGIEPAESLHELVEAIEAPRVIWIMVPEGAPVDEMLFGEDGHGGLAELLSPGDTVIDGGNSRHADAAPRAARLAERGIGFVDCGTSGGPAGARDGACLMVGGGRETFDVLEPMFADVAAPGAYKFFTGHGAGHFVKMVHNGIEYGMMQAIAEGFHVLHESPYVPDLGEVADVYQHRSVVESRLVGWLQDAYAERGGDLDGVSAVVGHSGEGEWTIEAARELGVPVPVIEDSLAARVASTNDPNYAGRVLTALRNGFGGHGLGPGGGPRR